MKNKFVLAGALFLTAATTMMSCGPAGPNFEPGKTVEDGKIGFILPGSLGNEMKAFQARWNEIGAQYGIEIAYKQFKGNDPAYYGTLANELIALGCDAIVCNFEMDGKETIIEKCIQEEIYVAYSGSTVSEEVFEEYKMYPYFLGQISPSPETEENQAYDMTKYFLDLYYGENKVAIPAGTTDQFAVWPADFHGIDLAHQMTYRWKGIKKALAEYGAHVKGDEDFDSANWTVDYDATSPLKDKVIIMGNNLADYVNLQAACLADLQKNPNTVVTTCSGDYLFGLFTSKGVMSKGTRFATIDSLNAGYNKWYDADPDNELAAFRVAHDPYIIGKYIAINEPVIDICARAFNGTPLRQEDGAAVNLNQTFWRSQTKAQYEKASTLSRSYTWGKSFLETIETHEEYQQLFDKTTLEYVSNLEK